MSKKCAFQKCYIRKLFSITFCVYKFLMWTTYFNKNLFQLNYFQIRSDFNYFVFLINYLIRIKFKIAPKQQQLQYYKKSTYFKLLNKMKKVYSQIVIATLMFQKLHTQKRHENGISYCPELNSNNKYSINYKFVVRLKIIRINYSEQFR